MALAVPDGLRSLGQRFRNSLTGKERLIVLVTPLLAGLLVCVGVLLWHKNYSKFDDQLFNFWLKSRNSHLGARDLAAVSPQIMLVAIDEESTALFNWPFPRDAYEEIVRRLKLIGATTIGFDLLFAEAGASAPADDALAATLADPSIVLACPLTLSKGKVAFELPYKPLIAGWKPEDLVKRLGFTQVFGDAEDVKGVGLSIRQDQTTLYSWPVVVLAHHQKKTPQEVLGGVRVAINRTWFTSPTTEEIDSVEVETTEAWPNIPGQIASLVSTINIKQLMEYSDEQLTQLYPATGQPKIAVMGVTVKGGTDVKQTMVGMMSGPEIQACTIINLMLNNFLQPFSQGGEMGLVLLLSLWAGALGGQLNLRPLLAGMLASAVGLVLLQGSLLAGAGFGPGWLMPVVAPLISLIASTGVAGAVQTVFVRRAQGEKMLHLLQEICPISDIEAMPVGKNLLLGEECHATIGLLDLRRYAAMASSQEVGDISAVGDHIRAWHEIVMIFGGVVVDYDGSIMRVAFGINPASAEKHALAACGAGLALLAEYEQRRSGHANLPAPTMAIATGNLRLGMKARPTYRSQTGATGTSYALLKIIRVQAGIAPSEATLEAAGSLVPTQPSPVSVKVLARDTEALVKIQAAGDWQKRDSNRINAADLKVGDDLGKYKLDKFLGQGGMGRVFRAVDPHLQRPVALKVLTGNIDQLQSERFVKEARAVARVTHPGIVNVYDAGIEPAPYMAMEYAPGNDLSHMLKAEAPLKPKRAVDMILQVLDALAVVHEAGIVHRDLKPANVMVDSDEKTKLMDFGLARFMDEETRLTRAGEIWGTPEYMAPEQVDDEFGQVDSISDLFAVATILYECLTGKLPVRSGTVSTVIYDLVFRQADPPENHNADVTPELSEIVLHGLEKEKADRYQTAREFAAALRATKLD